MNTSTLIASAHDEATQRAALGVIADVTAFIVSFSLLNAVLSLALWAWLAWLIAAVSAVLFSYAAHVYAATSGYDHAVSAVASVKSFFTRKAV